MSRRWDITKLHGSAKWTYYYLYVILDIYSRYAVGWMLATCESAVLAEKLIAETCTRQHIAGGQLSIHADRGSSMTSKPVALLLARRPGRHPVPFPAARMRQPLLRSSVQDPQIPTLAVFRSAVRWSPGNRYVVHPGGSQRGSQAASGFRGIQSTSCCAWGKTLSHE
jgi:transposase InsO family protein